MRMDRGLVPARYRSAHHRPSDESHKVPVSADGPAVYTRAIDECRVSWARQMECAVRVVAMSFDQGPRVSDPRSRPFLWVYRGRLFSTKEDLEPDDVAALAFEAENKRKMAIARARALAEIAERLGHNPPRRDPIPDEVKVLVWQRDGGVSVRCGSNRDLELDHIIPLVMGGANTARNVQLLCERCNRAKGGSLV